MDIKEIALRIGEKADEYADAKLQSKGEFHPDWHTVRDEYFAEAIVAELAKGNEPVAWAIYVSGDLCEVFQNKDFALLEFNRRNQLYPEPSRELRGLYTFPPTAEQIANETEWKPIETAPKDGTRIVVGYGRQSGFPMKIVYWKALHKIWMHYGEWEPGLERNATHWMPLPTPPKRSMEGV